MGIATEVLRLINALDRDNEVILRIDAERAGLLLKELHDLNEVLLQKCHTLEKMVTFTDEPVAWQYRTRPQWGSHLWTAWAECKKEVAEDYLKIPVSREWEYEVRVLYTNPRPKRHPSGFEWVGLTDDEIHNLEWMDGMTREERVELIKDIEAKLKEKNT